MNKEIWILDIVSDTLKEVKKSQKMKLTLKELPAKYHRFVMFRETDKNGVMKYIGKVNFSFPALSIYEVNFSDIYEMNYKISCGCKSSQLRRSINFEDYLFRSTDDLVKKNKADEKRFDMIKINDKISKKLNLPSKVPMCKEDREIYTRFSSNIPILFLVKGIFEYIQTTSGVKNTADLEQFLISFFINSAIESVTKKDYEKAIDRSTNILLIDPTNFLAHFQIGNIMFEFNNYDHAIQHYQIALKYNRSDIEVENYLALAYLGKKQEKKAMGLWNKLLKKDPNNVSVLTNIAETYLKNKKFDEAIEYFEKIISIEADNYYVKNSLAVVYASLHKVDKALELWNDLINTTFDNEFLHFNIAQANFELKNWKEAYKEYKKVITIIENAGDPEDVEQLKEISNQLILKIEEEMTELKEKENKGNSGKDLNNAVNFLNIRENISEEVREELEAALQEAFKMKEEDPDNEWVYYSIGSIYLQLGELKKSEEFLNRSLDIEPNNNIVYHALASLKVQMEDLESAVKLYKKVLIIKPPSDYNEIYEKWNYKIYTAYFNLGDCYIQMNKLDEAIECFKKGLEYDIRTYLAHFQIATCYEAKEKFNNAIKSYKNSILLNNKFDMAYLRLGNLYFRMQKWEEAKSIIEEMIDKIPESELIEQGYFLLSEISKLS